MGERVMATIEVLAIGDEVLGGFTVNSNATFIAKKLREEGFEVLSHRVVPDAERPLSQALEEAIDRYDLLICTGGLGPTLDDRTREIIAKVFGTSLKINEEVLERLHLRYGKDGPSLQDQATIPKTAQPFHNSVGTAPGLLLRKGRCTVIFLPGVPTEMREMFSEHVLPYMREHFVAANLAERVILNVCRIRESDVDAVLREIVRKLPGLRYGIYPCFGTATVHLMSEDASILAQAEAEFRGHFGPRIYEQASMSEAIQWRFTQQGLTLATAESCTGGALAASLTRCPGASGFFLGGVVAYSNELKQKILGVSPQTLQNYGAVSRETVSEMAEGMRQLSGSDFALATSGIAGPTGASSGKPVGTVWFAIAQRGSPSYTELFQLSGNREAITLRSVYFALGTLWLHSVFDIDA